MTDYRIVGIGNVHLRSWRLVNGFEKTSNCNLECMASAKGIIFCFPRIL
jgi:hypothetical protein